MVQIGMRARAGSAEKQGDEEWHDGLGIHRLPTEYRLPDRGWEKVVEIGMKL
jgi:hypothetical protein